MWTRTFISLSPHFYTHKQWKQKTTMKIKEGTFYCPICSTTFNQDVNRTEGKTVIVDQVICPTCPGKTYVSQKTKMELEG